MSPVVPHAVFLACLFTASWVEARESTVGFAVVHEAALDGDTVRWNTRFYDCGKRHPEQRQLTTVRRLVRTGTNLRLDPPLVASEPVQVVVLRDPSLVFVPAESLLPHRTRHGFEVWRPDPASREELQTCLRAEGVRLPPSALLVAEKPVGGPKAAPSNETDMPASPLEGRLVGRQQGARAVLGVSAAILVAAVGGLTVAWRRLARRVRLEAAEAILRADIPDL